MESSYHYKTPKCQYCKKRTRLVKYRKKNVYCCEQCDARVSVHKNTLIPMGTVAKGRLRYLRIKCHELIDSYWLDGKFKRNDVYRYIAHVLELKSSEMHIARFDEEMCIKLISLFEETNNKRGNKHDKKTYSKNI